MKLALIPPYSRLLDTTKTDYQLCLAHLMDQDPTYTAAYKAMCQAKGQYVILDNGAFEGSLVAAKELLEIACRYKVTEIVIPDRMKNADVTIEMAKSFYAMAERTYHAERFRFMFVVQGDTWYEMNRCLHWAMEQRWIHTIAIPRHTLETCLDATARLNMAETIKLHSKKAIHFLGASPLWPEEIIEAAKSKIVRGMDTSMAYVYGIAGKPWPSQDFIDSALTRDVYFQTILNKEQEELIDVNVERMLKYAN